MNKYFFIQAEPRHKYQKLTPKYETEIKKKSLPYVCLPTVYGYIITDNMSDIQRYVADLIYFHDEIIENLVIKGNGYRAFQPWDDTIEQFQFNENYTWEDNIIKEKQSILRYYLPFLTDEDLIHKVKMYLFIETDSEILERQDLNRQKNTGFVTPLKSGKKLY